MKDARNLPALRNGMVSSLRDSEAQPAPADLHRFIASPAGVLVHYTNSQLRAIVPPQKFDDYVALWPESAAAVSELRRARDQVAALAQAVIERARASARQAGKD